MHSSVAVVIVNYQTGDMVLNNLEKIRAELAAFERAMIYVVDNASPNGDIDLLRQNTANADDIEVIDAGANLGFAGGCNLGYERALAANFEFALFLNPDACPQPGALSELHKCLTQTPDAAIAGAQILDDNGALSACSFRFPTILREFAAESETGFFKRLFGSTPDHTRQSIGRVQTQWVSGAAFLLRTSAAPDLMDGDYFLYYEEMDMMYRLAQEGWGIWHCPDAHVVHIGGVATGVGDKKQPQRRLPDYWFVSWRRYFIKNHGRFYAILAASAKVAGILTSYVSEKLRGVQIDRPAHYLSDTVRFCLLASFTDRLK